MKPRLFLPATLALTLLTAAGALAQNKDALVLARVNGEEITRKQLVARLVEYRGDEAVERMVNRAILQQEATRLKVTVTDAETDQKLTEIQKRFKNDTDYKEFLAKSKVQEAQLREELRNTLLIQKVALHDNPIKDEELDQYDVRLLATSDKATAEKWIKELDGGNVNFARMATERSTDPALKAAGGRLRPFLKIEMIDIWNAINDQKLKPGGYTKTPVQLSEKNWAIIKYEALIPASSASESEKDRLKAAVLAWRVDQWLNNARTKAKVEKKGLNDAAVAMVNGQPIPRAALVERLLAYSGEEALEQLANRTMLVQAAKSAGVKVEDAEANQRFEDAKKAIGDDQRYRSYLASANLSEKQFQDELRYTLLMEKVALKESPITDEDLTRYEARIMTVPSLKVGQEWVAELDKGADFAKMTTERSLNAESRPSGGRTRPFLKVDLLDVWRAIDSQKLKPGSYTKIPVLLTDNSWVLIKLEAIQPASGLSKEDREKLVRQITRYRVDQWLTQAKQRAKITYPTPLNLVIKEG